MRRGSCDGEGLLEGFRAAVLHLQLHVEEINALNVFPVPDGDTGSNMSATLRAALDEAEALPVAERTVERVAAAIAFGSLMGARGNSGVILSQILRGMASGLEGRRRVDGRDLAAALARGNETAYAAVVQPVEGTILTVVREASVAAGVRAERTPALDEVLEATVEAAARAVAETPRLLPVLRDAGVVDAGGQGLWRLLQGASRFAAGAVPLTAPSAVPGGPLRSPSAVAAAPSPDGGFGYETMFLITADDRDLDPGAIRSELERLGDSVLVAGDAGAVKIHVHGPRPDGVLAVGLAWGTLSHVSVENLDHQASQVLEMRAAAFTGLSMAGGGEPGVTEPQLPRPAEAAAERGAAVAVAEAPVAVVAVAAGDGLVRAFESFGVTAIVRGGQSANPSTGELLHALRAVPSRRVLVLPNNPNVKLAAQQAAALCPEKEVVVLPTRNPAEGIAAMLAFDPATDAAANRGPMADAARAVRTLQVTQAVRDARLGGRKVRRGQAIALDPDEGLLAVARDVEGAALEAVEKLGGGFELLTVYYGDGVEPSAGEELAARLREAHPGAEVELVHGGQPHYRYLIAAE